MKFTYSCVGRWSMDQVFTVKAGVCVQCVTHIKDVFGYYSFWERLMLSTTDPNVALQMLRKCGVEVKLLEAMPS